MHTVTLADGDAVALHESQLERAHAATPAALLVHGLGGCHRSAYIQRVAGRLARAGWRVFRLDLRGTGAGIGLARRFYNAACSDDIRAALELIHRLHSAAPLFVAGFSLGGNIVLRLLAEAAVRPVAGLQAAAVVAPPVDLEWCSRLISRLPFYDRFYVRHLVAQVRQHTHVHRDLPPIEFPRRTTLRQFDDLYTAPRWGYADALDYYRRASAGPLAGRIEVPCLILSARDDPFVAAGPLEALTGTRQLQVELVDHGGHLGFLGGDGQGGLRWAETRVVQWLMRHYASG
jgi:predicted alpha/beta-fold hydrolase